MNLKIPIYFSAGLTIQANMYYKMLIGWTSQKVKDSYATQNAFDFKHVCSFDRSLINAPGPCVLFATPGMISGGFSLEVFKQWAPSEMNLITLPGYCVAGTIGHKLMSGKATKIYVDKDTQVDVRCQIHQLSFSPHTDSKGIMDLVKFLSPKHVILVHGEKPKMATLKRRIQSELQIPCYDPANNDTVHIPSTQLVKIDATKAFIQDCLNPNFECVKTSSDLESTKTNIDLFRLKHRQEEHVAEGILIMDKTKRAKAVHQDELLPFLGVEEHAIQCAYCFSINVDSLLCIKPDKDNTELSKSSAASPVSESVVPSGSLSQSTALYSSKNELPCSDQHSWLQLLFLKLSNDFIGKKIKEFSDHLELESFHVAICRANNCPYKIKEISDSNSIVSFCCKWSLTDEKLAWKVISLIKGLDSSAAQEQLCSSTN